jgi:preprotein translocase subunit YajC
MSGVLYWVVLVAVMGGAWYFLMMRPQRKKAKEHDTLIKNLGTGSRVVTVAGIYGVIDSVGEGTFVLKLEDGAKMKVSKSSIAGLEEIEEPSSA